MFNPSLRLLSRILKDTKSPIIVTTSKIRTATVVKKTQKLLPKT